MARYLPSGRARLALNLCAAGAVAALMAGCSSDSTRLSDPFGNPFSTGTTTPVQHVSSLRSGLPGGRQPPVVSQALPASGPAVASAAPLRPRLTTAYNAPISRETTGSIEPAPARSAPGASFGGWTSNGGAPITVGQGESAEVLSQRYGVPMQAFLQTNGLRSPADVHPGVHMTVPVYNAIAARQAPAVAAAEPIRPAPARVAEAAPPRERPARPLAKAALLKPRAERIAAATERTRDKHIAAAQPVAPAPARGTHVKPQARLAARPGTERAEVKHALARAEPAPVKQVAIARPLAPAPAKVALARPAPVRQAIAAPAAAPATTVAQRQPDPAPTASVPASAPSTDASGNPEFRWPARGRIIQGFKGGNDGINIAVPEGTAVKAAETGVVAYAGSELKGYGNLVLIRHPNGFVTAYANNGELDVKRGDQVKRGQTIAKSGQSGNVSSPQLHFELRKGSTPVDPTSYLAGL